MTIKDRRICLTKRFEISPGELWARWTTREGLLTFFGADNHVELRPGGPFEIFFLMDNPPGLRGSEGCEILSFLPEKMLSFSWNAPPQFAEIRNGYYKTWVVILFHETENGTELSLSHLGWPDDSGWNGVYEYFEKAWERVLASLESAVA